MYRKRKEKHRKLPKIFNVKSFVKRFTFVQYGMLLCVRKSESMRMRLSFSTALRSATEST